MQLLNRSYRHMKREYIHVEKTTLPLAIGIESNCASHDTNNNVDGDGE